MRNRSRSAAAKHTTKLEIQETLENLEILEILENPQTLKNKGVKGSHPKRRQTSKRKQM